MKKITQDKIDKFFSKNLEIKNRYLRRFKDFSYCYFNELNFKNCNFDYLKFDRASFYYASFCDASFYGASFYGASFYGASFCYASFKGASFCDVSFDKSSFDKSSFYNVSFRDASFDRASFYAASFYYACFYKSSFCDASFDRAYFCDASFDNASFDRAYFNRKFKLLFCDKKTQLKKLGYETYKNYFVGYKSFSENYGKNKKWFVKIGSTIIERKIDKNIWAQCSYGINVATRKWCIENCKNKIYKVKIYYDCEIVIPYNTDGKIRVSKAEIIEELKK